MNTRGEVSLAAVGGCLGGRGSESDGPSGQAGGKADKGEVVHSTTRSPSGLTGGPIRGRDHVENRRARHTNGAEGLY
ncbi:hypothetical protein NBRC116588_01660 [Pyruvatibacter sp. HU-CL02332]